MFRSFEANSGTIQRKGSEDLAKSSASAVDASNLGQAPSQPQKPVAAPRLSLQKKRQNPKSPVDLRSTTPLVTLTPTRFAFELPLPPSINSQYATVNGRRVLSSTGRRYKAAIAQILLGALAQSPNRATFLNAAQSHYLTLSIHFYFPTLLRRDLDGGLKIAQDALCEAMGINDNRIVEIHLYKSLDRESPRLDCALSTTSPAPIRAPRKTRLPRPTNRRIRS
ncbi:MAG: RusA family crossover junction endodeoxyribonuclease [Nitrospirales bacterium]|jgi:crossover junction endodeoxyribonuclease RusA